MKDGKCVDAANVYVQRRYVVLWGRKESFIKATGQLLCSWRVQSMYKCVHTVYIQHWQWGRVGFAKTSQTGVEKNQEVEKNAGTPPRPETVGKATRANRAATKKFFVPFYSGRMTTFVWSFVSRLSKRSTRKGVLCGFPNVGNFVCKHGGTYRGAEAMRLRTTWPRGAGGAKTFGKDDDLEGPH